MRTRARFALLALLLSSCATSNFAPPTISPGLIAAGRADRASAEQLTSGRALFVTRCLECHTLPAIGKYSPEQWPGMVTRMAARADLTSAQQQAVIAYLRAASSHPEPSRRATLKRAR